MSTTQPVLALAPQRAETIYNRTFWLAYAANLLLVTANALTFRFAELVAFLRGNDQMAGSSEQMAGAIVSIGVMGALVARLVLGQAIDRYGVRKLWTLTSLLFLFSCGMFLTCRELSWQIYVARVSFAVALAGTFTCSFVHIQNHVPSHRRTEVIGSLGTAGFLGMTIGSQLGDLIFNVFPPGRLQFLALFGGAAVLGLVYLAVVTFLTRNEVHQRPRETPAAHRLIFRYWPGNVAFVAMMAGVSFTVVSVFLTRFATHMQLNNGLGTFFTAFAVSAFMFRVFSRRWSHSIGRHKMILMGLSGQFLGFCSLPEASQEWHFIGPALACGFGHALLFPAVMSLGCGAFPKEYRGSGTTMMLGFTEIGAMISAPLLGAIIDHFHHQGMTHLGFRLMFYTTAGIGLAIGTLYSLTEARKPDDEFSREEHKPLQEPISLLDESALPDQETEDSVAVPVPQLGRSA
jgi:MFS family permease